MVTYGDVTLQQAIVVLGCLLAVLGGTVSYLQVLSLPLPLYTSTLRPHGGSVSYLQASWRHCQLPLAPHTYLSIRALKLLVYEALSCCLRP